MLPEGDSSVSAVNYSLQGEEEQAEHVMLGRVIQTAFCLAWTKSNDQHS